MKYLFAIILPPVSLLLVGKPFQAIISFFLTLCFWVPGVIHALFVVNQSIGDKRHQQMMDAMAAQVGVKETS